MGGPTGYLHPDYAESLREFGRPRALSHSGGYLLERPIPGTSDRDAMGCYPLLCCANWPALGDDLRDLDDLVSVVCVVDPFSPCDRATLAGWFDVVVDFKTHFVTELTRPAEDIVSASHQATARRALRRMKVEVCAEPAKHLNEWSMLFDHLVRRRHITGLRAFSGEAFTRQLALPGMVMFRATSPEGQTIGMDLWYVQGDVAYGHLAAFSPLGYELRASYGTKWHVLRYFHGKVRWLDLAGTSGINARSDDGLTVFKRGWATGTRTAFLCGKIIDRSRYERLCAARGVGDTRYFPAYREGEFE